MKQPFRITRINITIYLVLAILFGMVAQGCSTSKKCGCKGDLNSVYKPKKRYR